MQQKCISSRICAYIRIHKFFVIRLCLDCKKRTWIEYKFSLLRHTQQYKSYICVSMHDHRCTQQLQLVRKISPKKSFPELKKINVTAFLELLFFVFYASKTVETMRMQPSVPKNIISTIANIHANFCWHIQKNGLWKFNLPDICCILKYSF